MGRLWLCCWVRPVTRHTPDWNRPNTINQLRLSALIKMRHKQVGGSQGPVPHGTHPNTLYATNTRYSNYEGGIHTQPPHSILDWLLGYKHWFGRAFSPFLSDHHIVRIVLVFFSRHVSDNFDDRHPFLFSDTWHLPPHNIFQGQRLHNFEQLVVNRWVFFVLLSGFSALCQHFCCLKLL